MIYDKIPVILLSKIASLPDDTTNCRIASFILAHLETVHSESISELAKKCNVAVSSVSRFCRGIGLSDFFELKELLEDTELRFETASRNGMSEKERAKEHAGIVALSVQNVAESLDYGAIGELVTDIDQYQNVTAFGFLKAETAALNLQADLLMLKKFVKTKLAYDDQLRYINEADDRDLIIIFSYTGGYFVEGLWDVEVKSGKRPRVYLISGDASKKDGGLIYRTIGFSSPRNQIAHPYQLLFISSLISQEYCRRRNEEGSGTIRARI